MLLKYVFDGSWCFGFNVDSSSLKLVFLIIENGFRFVVINFFIVCEIFSVWGELIDIFILIVFCSCSCECGMGFLCIDRLMYGWCFFICVVMLDVFFDL